MFWRLLSAGLVLLALGGAWPASAATESGRETVVTHALRVCADPNNLPFSNDREEGFENRIAKLIADELGRPLRYVWWPQTVGFVRHTLRLRECDLILGIATGSELVQNTNPYYRSVYTMVYRTDSGLRATTLTDPALKGLRLGVVAGTPPATLLARYGLMGQARPYERTVDTRHFSPAREAVEDVAKGEIDVAVIWGPIAGYYAPRQPVPLTVVPLLEEPAKERLEFWISMAVRPNEPDWKHEINTILGRLQPQIRVILAEYGVPLLDDQGKLVTP